MRVFAGSLFLASALLVAACANPSARPAAETQKDYTNLVVGFAQIGAESTWRAANTLSIQETAQDLGVTLHFIDGQQQQENQIKAIRSFIEQKVDVIGVSPVVEDGWDAVFSEAKAAGIPIIVLDRQASVPDDLVSAFIGSDFRLEGERACGEMAALLPAGGNIVELEGTVGSSPAIARKAGFHECLKTHTNLQVIESTVGDFTRAQGKAVMQQMLATHGTSIQGLFAHNDDMALGAIEAIEEAGLKPGVDIKIVSVDGVQGAFDAMIAKKLNATVECNPLLGPQFFETALKLANGDPVEKWVKSNEGVFRQDTAAKDIIDRKY